MSLPNDRDVYYARCLRVAASAAASGVTMRKSDKRGRHALEVAGNGRSLEFPIVTDDRAWRETSAEEAFYVVLLDARSWSDAHVDDASLAALVDDTERAQMPLIRKDLGEETARIDALSEIVGGRAKLEALWSSGEFTNV